MDTDLASAWSCATSYQACRAETSPTTHDPHDLVDVHAYQLLILSEADPTRLAILIAQCRDQARAAQGWRGGARLLYRRRGYLRAGRVRFALRALTPTSRREVSTHWTTAGDLVQAALTMVRDAGADTDKTARGLLLDHGTRRTDQFDWSPYSRATPTGDHRAHPKMMADPGALTAGPGPTITPPTQRPTR